jgi:hypothetical protein
MFADQYERSCQTVDDVYSDCCDGIAYQNVMKTVGYSKYHHPFLFGVDGVCLDKGKKWSIDPIALVDLLLPAEDMTNSSVTFCGGI